MTENSLEIGIIGEGTVGVHGGERKSMPLFRKLTLNEVRDYLANIA
jgi:20S proteasome subunit alpha 2